MAAQAKLLLFSICPVYPASLVKGQDNQFDQWVERSFLRELFLLAGLLKLRLNKTTLEVFRLLSDTDKSCVETVIAALKKRFRPSDIKELRELKFHHLTQSDN